uniref:Uncharacterized protein LOC114338410 isoform X2 n=2 Tax=Diabrotica virgifera virgifera TaxID=50390 RepID=A0A6P7G723_DIAVI
MFIMSSNSSSCSSRESRGRKSCKVSSLFKMLKTQKKNPQVECTFCTLQLSKNGTRLLEHIKKCLKCPEEVKIKYGVTERKQRNIGLLQTIHEKREEKVKEKPKSQSKEVSAFMDKMTPEQKVKADELLSRAIYSSQAPLALVENIQWQKLFKFLRPAYQIPTRHLVSGPLLDSEHLRVKAMVSENIAGAHSVGLMVDGWSNIRNEAVLNFVVTTPKPFLFKIMPTGTAPHTAEYMAKTLGAVIREIGPRKVFGIVTDNAANMKAAWALIENDFDNNIFTYGCFAHSLNLIFTDLKNLTSLKSFTAEAVALTKAIRQSHILSAWVKEKQNELKISCSLKLPVPTRWGSLVLCLQSLLANKQIIKRMATNEEVEKSVSKHPS